jgi:phage tail sheath gpL-like
MYTFAVTAAVVTGTSRHGAAFGQDFDIRLNYGSRESLDAPPGITIAIANGVSGATDPAVSAAITAIGDQWFQTIVSGVNLDANMDLWETFAAAQWGPLIQQDVMVFAGYAGVYADALTYAGDRNSQFTVVPYMGVTPTPWWETVTRVAAASTAEPDPARPRQTLSIGAVSGPPVSAAFTRSDRETLLAAGISTLKIALDGAVTIERLVTTYTTNPAGLPDATFRNLETMLTLFALRFTTRARFQSKYPRHKLASDDANYGAGQAVITPKVARGELIALARQWEQSAWVEGIEQFKADLLVERNASDRDRLDALLVPDLVNQFRVFAGQIAFIL